MGRGVGITAFVLLMVSFPLPFVGNFISVLALLIASAAALSGERTWSVVTSLVGGVKLFWMSPSWMFMMYSSRLVEGTGPYGNAVAAQQRGTNTMWFYFTVLIVLAPLAIVLWQKFQGVDAIEGTSEQGGPAAPEREDG